MEECQVKKILLILFEQHSNNERSVTRCVDFLLM